MSKTRWLVAGAGMMGKILPPQILRVGGEVRGYLGITIEEASKSADSINLTPGFVGSFEDFEGQLGRSDVDAVYIATPNFLHAPMATKAARAGKHMLVEKPFAITPGAARLVFRNIEKAGVAAEINSQYRHAEAWDTIRSAIRENSYGAPTFIEMSYVQDWQCDPSSPIGWRPVIEIAGKGKLVPDLGAHVMQTTLDAYGGRFVEFDGLTFNVHPKRYKAKGLVETFSGAKMPTPQERPDLYEEMDMLDGGKYSGDDMATASFLLKTSSGVLVPGRYKLSQVDVGRKNSYTVDLVFENGRLFWDQEHPNQIMTAGPDGRTYVHERGSSPGIVGTPPGHPQGYGDEIARLLIKMDRVIGDAKGGQLSDAAFNEYTAKNIGDAVHVVEMCDVWLRRPLISVGSSGKYQLPIQL